MLANAVFNLPIVFFVQFFHHLVYVAQLLLILLLLTDPEQIFIELCKFLKDGSFLEIFFVILSYFYDWVDDSHDEGGVVAVFLKEDWLCFYSQDLGFLSECEVVADFNVVGENEVVFLVVNSIDLCDDLSHSRGASRGWSLRVVVSKVDEDVVDNIVQFDEKILLQLFEMHALSDLVHFLNLEDRFSEYWVEVDHYVFCCELHCFLLFQLLPAQKFKGSWYYIADSLRHELLHALLYFNVELAVHNMLTNIQEFFVVEVKIEGKMMF